MRITLQPSYVLHTRPYNETSALLDVFSLMYGRVHLLVRGLRTTRSRFRGLLRSFIPLLISWSGKTELMSLSAVEINGSPLYLPGTALLSGIYLNELLVRVLPRFDAHPQLFLAYQQTLQLLQYEPELQERSLRLFEKELLQEAGYGLSLDQEAMTGEAIVPDAQYAFLPGKGLVKKFVLQSQTLVFPGRTLLAFHQGVLEDREDLRLIKHLTRFAIADLLGNKPVRSRELFVK